MELSRGGDRAAFGELERHGFAQSTTTTGNEYHFIRNIKHIAHWLGSKVNRQTTIYRDDCTVDIGCGRQREVENHMRDL